MNRAFFLDRDGTLNVDTGYVMEPEQVILMSGVGRAIQKIKERGYLALVISNQSGVARGYGTERDVEMVNRRLNEILWKEYGVRMDAFYYCPHHPQAVLPAYKKDCECRKPKVGMFQRAIEDWKLDPTECFAVGDKKRDIQNVEQIGVKHAAMVGEGNYYQDLLSYVESVL